MRALALLALVAACGGPAYSPAHRLTPPPDQPRPMSPTVIPNLIATTDGAFVFSATASVRTGEARLVRTSPPALVAVAPIPTTLTYWPASAGHGYIGVHHTQLGYVAVSTLTSIDLDTGRVRWMVHLPMVEDAGIAGDAHVWVRRLNAASELRRLADGARVATFPRTPGVEQVHGAGSHLVVATPTAIASYRHGDATPVCAAELPAYPVSYQPAITLAARGGHAILDRQFPRSGVIDHDVLVIDAATCAVQATLPGHLATVAGDRVVWWIDTRAPSAAAPLPGGVATTTGRYHLAVTDLDTLRTRAIHLHDADELPSFTIAPDASRALVLPRGTGEARVPLRLIDLTTQVVTPLAEPDGVVIDAATDPPPVLFVPGAILTFTPTLVVRIDLTTAAVTTAPMPGDPVTYLSALRGTIAAVPGTRLVIREQAASVVLIDSDAMVVISTLSL